MLNMREPHNKKNVERYIRCVQWLSRFIQHLDSKAYPIQLLKRRNVPFKCTWQDKKTFDEIQCAVRDAQWLQHTYLDILFTVHADASEKDICAVLLQ